MQFWDEKWIPLTAQVDCECDLSDNPNTKPKRGQLPANVTCLASQTNQKGGKLQGQVDGRH
jgi:hypothetical protein